MNGVDYEALAGIYARYRTASPRILAYILKQIRLPPGPDVLEAGCGTGDFMAALADAWRESGGRVAGFDVSPGMLEQARVKHPGLQLAQGHAERRFPYEEGSFDLVFSVDMVHYLSDLDAYFREARRVLRPGGTALTVTDSEEDIRGRTMSRYFPEIVALEQTRYHPVSRLSDAMARAGFGRIRVAHTRYEGRFTPEVLDRYRQRIYSSLRLLPDRAYDDGLRRLEAALAAGDDALLELYTYVSGRA